MPCFGVVVISFQGKEKDGAIYFMQIVAETVTPPIKVNLPCEKV